MAHKVCVVTSSRSDYGPLKPLLFKMKNSSEINLILAVTGSHLFENFGNTQKEIQNDGFCNYDTVRIPMSDDSKEGMADTAGIALYKFACYFKKKRPELLVLLGDRFEILSIAFAAMLSGIPIAHISGGDITEGAIDDSIRHCITKLSSLHFPGCEQSRKRIIQMGEFPETVFNVGELGVENCYATPLLPKEELAKNLNFDILHHKFVVVTFHPVTRENGTGDKQVYELIKAMDYFKNLFYIITMANADSGGRAINNIWENESKKRSNWLFVSSLGVRRYLSSVKYSEMVLGNSSSGIMEAPALGVPTVNIGDRQKGRMISASVICCNPLNSDIILAMGKAMSLDFKKSIRNVMSPFGDGTASKQIFRRIKEYLNSKHDPKKEFYDIDFKVPG